MVKMTKDEFVYSVISFGTVHPDKKKNFMVQASRVNGGWGEVQIKMADTCWKSFECQAVF